MRKTSRIIYAKGQVILFLALFVILLSTLLENNLADVFSSLIVSGIVLTCKHQPENRKVIFVFASVLIYNFINLYWLFNTTYYFQITLLIIILTLLYVWPILMICRGKYANGVLTWITIDFAMLHLDIGFPLMSLSHHWAFMPELIQFSKYFGSLGVNVFILLMNIVIITLFNFQYERKIFWSVCSILLLFQALNLKATLEYSVDKRNLLKVVALNTNLVCPSEKYSKSTKQLYSLYRSKIESAILKDNYALIVLPETSFDSLSYLDHLKSNVFLRKLHEISPNSNMVLGSVLYQDGFKFENNQPNGLYESGGNSLFFTNSTIFISNNEMSIRHKSKLVPFNEYIPNSISSVMPNGNIIDFRHFRKVEPSTEPFKDDLLKIGVGICYESLFGEFISEFVLSGANLLVFQYNEGWYHSLYGARKMLANAALRANEQNKFVVSSSNCGYSAIVDSNGKIVDKSSNGIDLSGKVYLNAKITPYSYLGDMLGWIAVLSIFLNFIRRSREKDAKGG